MFHVRTRYLGEKPAGEDGSQDRDGSDGDNRGYGNARGEDRRIFSYFLGLNHGKVPDGHGRHEAHRESCNRVKTEGAHRKDNANGYEEHAKEDIAPDA